MHDTETLTLPYAEPDGQPLLLHIFRPKGPGPWPAILDIHGGAWTYFAPEVDFYWCRELARRGFLVASIEFRLAPAHPWPTFLSDVRAASRWLRRNGAAHGADVSSIGVMGGSTGGHLATMLGLLPSSTGHTPTPALNTPDDADAHVDYVVALWPILDVPGRYELVTGTKFGPLVQKMAQRRIAGQKSPGRGRGMTGKMRRLDALRVRAPIRGAAFSWLVQRVMWLTSQMPVNRAVLFRALARAHEQSFRDVREMEEASPIHRVRQGLVERMPPIRVIQGAGDSNTTAEMSRAFARAYQERGGQIDVHLVPRVGHSYGNIPSRDADALIEEVATFARQFTGSSAP